MKLLTFSGQSKDPCLAVEVDQQWHDVSHCLHASNLEGPSNMMDFLNAGVKGRDQLEKVSSWIRSHSEEGLLQEGELHILAPVPQPPSCRDAYAFRQHVAASRRNRGLDMIPEFDQFPIFYFTNHQAIVGPGDVEMEQDHFHSLDFELEIAIVVGRRGKNIAAEEADEYIAGYTIMNDFSARRLQMEEMRLNLGPAKGKDFATAIGPYLVTPDELQSHCLPSDRGNRYDLAMKARHNGEAISLGNAKDMTHTFAEILERVSYGVDVFPGEVIGSGTVGTGCYLELNGTRKIEAEKRGEAYTPIWLKPGDEIELEIDGLGCLKHRVHLNPNAYSILEKKK